MNDIKLTEHFMIICKSVLYGAVSKLEKKMKTGGVEQQGHPKVSYLKSAKCSAKKRRTIAGQGKE